MNINNTEIERKFLIRKPSEEILAERGSHTQITQTYLISEAHTTERVRKRGDLNSFVYTHTIKMKVNDLRRIEIENEITESEYNELLKRADTARNVIHKTRWCIEYEAQLLEIDIFPFWNDRAYMEIELTDEAQEIFIPPFIEVIKEVTSDKRYSNASLAKEIPYDEI